MNIVAVTRFLGNLLVSVGFVVVILLAMPGFPGVSGWVWVALLLGFVLVSGIAQLVVMGLRPQEAKTANDEQVALSNKDSYLFGYWCVMVVFLVLLGFVLTDRLSATQAFFFLGLPLGIGPSIYMVFAFLRGRAG